DLGGPFRCSKLRVYHSHSDLCLLGVFSHGEETTAPVATGGIDVALYVVDDDHIVLCVGAKFDGMEQMDRDSKDIVHVSRRICAHDDARAGQSAGLGGCSRSWRMGSKRRR